MPNRHGLTTVTQHWNLKKNQYLYSHLTQEECASNALDEAAQEMDRLNDFCVLCLDGVAGRLDSMVRWLRDIDQQGSDVETKDDIVRELNKSELVEYQIPAWREIHDRLTPAMGVSLLCAFIEKILKTLCKELKGATRVTRGSTSKVDFYLDSLRRRGLSIKLKPQWYAQWKSYQKIRNAYMHGDEWDKLSKLLSGVRLCDVFRVASDLCLAAEKAYPSEQESA